MRTHGRLPSAHRGTRGLFGRCDWLHISEVSGWPRQVNVLALVCQRKKEKGSTFPTPSHLLWEVAKDFPTGVDSIWFQTVSSDPLAAVQGVCSHALQCGMRSGRNQNPSWPLWLPRNYQRGGWLSLDKWVVSPNGKSPEAEQGLEAEGTEFSHPGRAVPKGRREVHEARLRDSGCWNWYQSNVLSFAAGLFLSDMLFTLNV